MGGGLAFRSGEIKKEYERKAEERETEFRRLEKKKRDARVKKQPRYDVIEKKPLFDLYITQKESIREIAKLLGFSTHKVSYWLLKYNVRVRNKSDAGYIQKNKNKNHLLIRSFNTRNREFLLGIGCGACWRGGVLSKKTSSLQLSGEDPRLLRIFIYFIEYIFGIKKSEVRVYIRIKEGSSITNTVEYWTRELGILRSQIQKKIVIVQSGGKSEKRNAKYGTATIRVHDKKLKNIFLSAIKKISF